MIDVRNIFLTDDEIKKCREFSVRSAQTQQPIEYGQHDTKPRSPEEIARDNLIGKIAEVAFKKIMRENYGLNVDLDFNYYPRGEWDSFDTEINGWRIDVKATRSGSKWMLIERNKLEFRRRENKLPDLFVVFTVGWNRNTDQPTGWVRYEGAKIPKRLLGNDKDTHFLQKGDILPGTKTVLQADNYGVKLENLRDDFDKQMDWLCQNPKVHD